MTPGLARPPPPEQVKVEKEGRKFLDQVGTKDVEKYTTKALMGRGCRARSRHASLRGVLLVVVSIYMLLDMDRFTVRRRPALPPRPRRAVVRMEQALASYVKGQIPLSLIIGASAGTGLGASTWSG